MRENINKGQKLFENRIVNLHRNVGRIQRNAMLVIVNIRRILKLPELAVYLYRHNPVVLPCGKIKPAGIALALRTQRTRGISGFRRIFCRGNGARILFRLCKVYRNIKRAILRLRCPFHITRYSVTPDIIGILRKIIIPVGRALRAFKIHLAKL